MDADNYAITYKHTRIAGFTIDHFEGNCGYRILSDDWVNESQYRNIGLSVKDISNVLVYLLCKEFHTVRMIVFSDYRNAPNELCPALLSHPLVTSSVPVLQNSAPLWTIPSSEFHIQLGYFSPFNLMYIKKRIPSPSLSASPGDMIMRYTNRKRMVPGLKPILPKGVSIRDFSISEY